MNLTPLVGRRDEVADLRRQLGENRLVTLLGPGGVGKTRLAAETARSAREVGKAEVYWAELAPVNADVIDLAIADAVGAHEGPGLSPWAAIAEALGSRQVLLVLDNAEHVVASVAQLGAYMLATCAGLRSWPRAGNRWACRARSSGGSTLCRCLVPTWASTRYWSVKRLSCLCSGHRAAFPSFDLNSGNAGAVCGICQQLDGLPLAIELAVANLRMLPVEEIASSLDNVFRLLVGGPRTSPARHQTLRATLDWSQQLLDADEKELLRRLSVFVGSFSLEAASRVAVPGGDGSAAYDALRRLVDKSLVVAEVTNGQAKYRLLATVRQYRPNSSARPARWSNAGRHIWAGARGERPRPNAVGGSHTSGGVGLSGGGGQRCSRRLEFYREMRATQTRCSR